MYDLWKNDANNSEEKNEVSNSSSRATFTYLNSINGMEIDYSFRWKWLRVSATFEL